MALYTLTCKRSNRCHINFTIAETLMSENVPLPD